METRHKIELGIALLVLLGFIVLLAIFMRNEPPQDVVVDDVPGELNEADDRSPHPDNVDPEDIPSTNEVSAATIGRTFVERFGSYSSESDFANVDDVLALATESFQNELEGIAERARRQADDAYYGISTIVISTSTVTSTDTAVTLRMLTQREEAIDDPSNTSVRYQEILVDLVNVGNDWLVDGFTWQES